MFAGNDEHYKYIDLPLSNYASASFDKIVDKNGKIVGLSMFARLQLQRALDAVARHRRSRTSQLGDEVTLVWGERTAARRSTVERHKQLEIRATVSAVPYSKFVRETYAAGWRTGT